MEVRGQTFSSPISALIDAAEAKRQYLGGKPDTDCEAFALEKGSILNQILAQIWPAHRTLKVRDGG